MNKRIIVPSLSLLLTVWLGRDGSCTAIPELELKKLVDLSDVIVVGEITEVYEKGASVINIGGHDVAVHLMLAQMSVARAIKGSSAPFIQFRFLLPMPESMGYEGVSANSFRVLLLKRTSQELEPTSPFYPSFPAVPTSTRESGNPLDDVIAEIAAVLQSTQASYSDKLRSIMALEVEQSAVVTDALEAAAQDTDLVVRFQAVTRLLARNDVSVLPIVEQELTNPTPEVPDYIRQNLASGISRGVRSESAIPALNRLMLNRDVRVRRAVANSLRQIKSPATIEALLSALDDVDWEVKYYGVIGLADLFDQKDWRPLREEFRADEKLYLEHWRNWAKKR